MNAVRWCTACLFFCAVMTVWVGCKKKGADSAEGRPGLIVGEKEKLITELLPEDVIVSVNGEKLTRQKYDEILDRMTEIYRSSSPASQKQELAWFRQAKAKTLVNEFVTKQTLLQEAKQRGLKPSPANLSTMEKLLAWQAKKTGKTTEEFLRSLGPAADAVRQDVADQALIITLQQAEFGDRLHVTEADIKKMRDRALQYNEMCAKTNALATAKAKAICKRLGDGEDFFAVADKESDDKDSADGVWGVFARGEIEDAKVRHAAFTLPVGAFSQPIDTEDGLVIIKVLERTGVDSPVAEVSATVKLGRILLHMGEYDPVKNDAMLRDELTKKRLLDLQREWLPVLSKKMRVEFPNGTNLWKKAEAR